MSAAVSTLCDHRRCRCGVCQREPLKIRVQIAPRRRRWTVTLYRTGDGGASGYIEHGGKYVGYHVSLGPMSNYRRAWLRALRLIMIEDAS
jgi:hypothetical protein